MSAPALRWTPLRRLIDRPGLPLEAAERLLDAGRAELTCGDYRWRAADGFLGRIVVLHDGAGLRALAAHTLEDNDDPEVAVAAGHRVIRVPLLTGATPDTGATAESIAGLVDALRAVHGDLRVTVNRPASDNAWGTALEGAGFRADSAMSVGAAVAAPPPERAPFRIRPAAGSDAAAAADLFEQSLRTLAGLSPFVAPERAAVEVVRARVGGCEGGRTGIGSQVWVAEDGAAGAVGIVETRRESAPPEYAILQTPLGESGCIDWIAVSPARRGGGTGAALVAHAQRDLADTGATTVYAYHLTGEEGPAAFWRRCGFAPAWTSWELAAVAAGTGG